MVHKPTQQEDAIRLAQIHEQKQAIEKGSIKTSLATGKPLQPNSRFPSISQPTPQQQPLMSTPSTPLTSIEIPFHRLSPIEAARHRSQGLCCNYDEKYTWDHKCKDKPQLLLFDDEPPSDLQPVTSDSTSESLIKKL